MCVCVLQSQRWFLQTWLLLLLLLSSPHPFPAPLPMRENLPVSSAESTEMVGQDVIHPGGNPGKGAASLMVLKVLPVL